ncbi:DUF2975 domain-containing protein [Sphingomonas sp.]|uniref:DUF2975 domain-containing protein n=1 Tax=Sphingomonas sp. TaxID=28214 RepID=UPI002C9B19F0|nr:DUF2975 domain-containing protein [Sphingomonas sp.]HTG39006.1 DUF2975 domain-containing protein [Sphingomonas sp.]
MPVNRDSPLKQAARVGLALSWIAVALTLLGGVLALVGSFDTQIGPATVLVRSSGAYLPPLVTWTGALSYFAFAYALWRLIAFLRLSREGQVFAAETTGHLRAFGRWLVVATLAATILPLAIIAVHVLVPAQAGTGLVPTIRIPLFTGLFVLTVATLVMMICRVIDEGRRLRDELGEIV